MWRPVISKTYTAKPMPHAINSRNILAVNESGVSICGSAVGVDEIHRRGDGICNTVPQAGHGKDRPR